LNNNVCCELGHLGNQDTSNGHWFSITI
jgi:hypothetical protein